LKRFKGELLVHDIRIHVDIHLIFVILMASSAWLSGQVHETILIVIRKVSGRQVALTSKLAISAIQARVELSARGIIKCIIVFVVNVRTLVVFTSLIVVVSFKVVGKQINACVFFGVFIKIVNVSVKVVLLVIFA
jgi:hypothetical protein